LGLHDKFVAQRLAELHELIEAGLLPRDGDFLPAVHYPPITMYPPITEESLFETYEMPPRGLLDVYVHIPFCEKACTFCHYPIKCGERHEEKDYYLGILEREMDLYIARLGISKIQVRSVLVGGGTPTYLTPEQLTRYLEGFAARTDMSKCTQYNYDLDPGTMLGDVGRERLEIMRSFGVDRLTIGIQALDDGTLSHMRRTHNTEEALASIERSLEMGFITNIEFIYGYAGQTLDSWGNLVEQSVKLGVEEIQLYRLKVMAYGDKQGAVRSDREQRQEIYPDFEETMRMKALAHAILNEHGYHENLNRVFSKDPDVFSHYADNQCCKLRDQVGFGLTAFSSLRDRFVLNTQFFDDYYKSVEEGRLPLNRGLVRSPEDQVRWSLILPLKNRNVLKSAFLRQAGVPLERVFPAKLRSLRDFGLIEEDEEFMSLTRKGRFVADEVVQIFYAPEFVPFPREAYNEGSLNPYLDCPVVE
jgi:oxygen-independent coproporphyrinogen III oxidase